MSSTTMVCTPKAEDMSSTRSTTRSRKSDKSLDLRLRQALDHQKFNESMEAADGHPSQRRKSSASTSMAYSTSATSGSTDTSTSWSSNVSPKTRKPARRSSAELPAVLPVEKNGLVRMESIDESAFESLVTSRRSSVQDQGEYYIKRYRKLSRRDSKWSEIWTTEHYFRPPGCQEYVAINRCSCRRSSDT